LIKYDEFSSNIPFLFRYYFDYTLVIRYNERIDGRSLPFPSAFTEIPACAQKSGSVRYYLFRQCLMENTIRKEEFAGNPQMMSTKFNMGFRRKERVM